VLAVEPEVVEQYVRQGKTRLVFRDVLNHGEYSVRASEAAACAGNQGYFWQMHEILFGNQEIVSSTPREQLQERMRLFGDQIEGLDGDSFSQCLQERSTLERLQAADSEQRSRGILSQPIFEINDQRLVGFQSFESIAAVIEENLK
jgi:protein-disulfide isomerase